MDEKSAAMLRASFGAFVARGVPHSVRVDTKYSDMGSVDRYYNAFDKGRVPLAMTRTDTGERWLRFAQGPDGMRRFLDYTMEHRLDILYVTGIPQEHWEAIFTLPEFRHHAVEAVY